MNESVIIQKLIQIGQMLERGELEYSGAEIDTKHYLEQYVALRQQNAVGRHEQFYCTCSRAKGIDHDEEGTPYCISCQKEVQ